MKEIEIKIDGSAVTALDRFSVIQHEISSTELLLSFSEDWEGLGIVVNFYDAKNEKAVCVPAVLQNGECRVSIPPEACAYSGEAYFIIDGFIAEIEENQDGESEEPTETVNYLIRTKPYAFKVIEAYKRGEAEAERILASDYERIVALLLLKADADALNNVAAALSGKADVDALNNVAAALSGKADADALNNVAAALSGKADADTVAEDISDINASVLKNERNLEGLTNNFFILADMVNQKQDKDEVYTKAEVLQQIAEKLAEMVASAPEALDTLNELAAALGNDPNFATTMATEIGKRAKSEEVYNKTAIDYIIESIREELNTKAEGTEVYKKDEVDWYFQSKLNQEQLDAIADVKNKANAEDVAREFENINNVLLNKADTNAIKYVLSELNVKANAEDVAREFENINADVKNKANAEDVETAMEQAKTQAKAYTDTKVSDVNSRIDAMGSVFQVKGSLIANEFGEVNGCKDLAEYLRNGHVFNIEGDGEVFAVAYCSSIVKGTVNDGILTVRWDDFFEAFPTINHDSLAGVYKDWVSLNGVCYKVKNSNIINGGNSTYTLENPPEDGEYYVTTFFTSIEVNNGDNVVWTDTGWDKLSGEIDLSGYYTARQVDEKIGAVPLVTIPWSAKITIPSNKEVTPVTLEGDTEFTLGNPIAGVSNEWAFTITQGEIAYDIVLPEIHWGLGIAPTFGASSITICRLYYVGQTLCGEWVSV